MEKALFTYKMYEHALFRFTSFVDKYGHRDAMIKMEKRIAKMTNVRKLYATKKVASDVGERKIATIANFRINQLA